MDWSELFGLSVSPLELIVRGSALYLFLFVLFRVVIKRRIGAIGMADILILVTPRRTGCRASTSRSPTHSSSSRP